MSDNTYFEHGYALLIGIRYGNDIKPLNGTLRDVEDIKNHFQNPDKAAYKAENVIALTEENATAAGILKALDELAIKANQDPDATVIVHYSGHGARVGEQYFFVPYDCDLQRLRNDKTFDEDKVVLSKQFVKKIDNIKADKKLIILDCCHAEDIVKRNLGDSPMMHFSDNFIDELDKASEAHSTRNVSPSKLKKGSGSVILTSCEAHEESLDLGTNGLFTQVMLECLNGKNNIRKDNWVRLIDMMNYIPMEVARRAAPHPQHPVFKRIENLRTGDFIICKYNNSTKRNLESDNQQPTTMSTDNIRTLISRGKLDDALEETQEALKTINDTDLIEQLAVLSDKHSENEKKSRIGIIDNREHGTTRSQVVYGLLGILNEIDKASEQTLPNQRANDSSSPTLPQQGNTTNVSGNGNVVIQGVDGSNINISNATSRSKLEKAMAKNGVMLYDMPDKMILNNQYKCIIRIATNKKILLAGNDINDKDKIEEIEMGGVMEVTLIDVSNSAFSVDSITDEEQFIDNDRVTSWYFLVTPHKIGTHPLILKIAIMQRISGKERKRNVIFEKQILVKSLSDQIEIVRELRDINNDETASISFVKSPQNPVESASPNRDNELQSFKKELKEIIDNQGFLGVNEVLAKISSCPYQYNKPTLANLRNQSTQQLIQMMPDNFLAGLKGFIDSIR